MRRNAITRINEDELAEHWFAFMHRLVGELQSTFRQQNSSCGLTQKDIAVRIGRDTGFVSKCLSGQQNMTVRTMHNIARGMDCRLEVALHPIDAMPPRNRRPRKNLLLEPPRAITPKPPNDGVFDVPLSN